MLFINNTWRENKITFYLSVKLRIKEDPRIRKLAFYNGKMVNVNNLAFTENTQTKHKILNTFAV